MSEIRKGSCHCGAVEFEVELEHGLDELLRCDCSICRRKSAVMMALPRDKISVIKGSDKLVTYRWNTRVARHYFCGTCGIYTHHRRRMAPDQCGFNVACLDGVDVRTLGDVTWLNGARLPLANEP